MRPTLTRSRAGTLARRGGTAAVLAALWLSAVAAQEARAVSPTRVSFVPQWLPQAQFAGFYLAARKGFYDARGLDVRILTGGPDGAWAHALASGGADCAALWLATALRLIDRGVPLLNLGQLVQRSSLLVVARRESGIGTPADLAGRRLAVWEGDFRVAVDTLLRRHGATARIVPIGPSVNLFLRGGVDATTATIHNEYHQLLAAGMEAGDLSVIRLAEHGVDLPEDGIYCRAALPERAPEVAAAFTAASLDGWAYAFRHPEETIDVVLDVMRAAKVPASRAHQRWMLARMRDLTERDPATDRPTGLLAAAAYARAADALVAGGWIREAPPFERFYRPAGG